MSDSFSAKATLQASGREYMMVGICGPCPTLTRERQPERATNSPTIAP
jgi:hypothetical protein